MRRTVFLAAACLMSVQAVSARQHKLDTEKSTLTNHVGKTGAFSGLGHEHEVRAPIHSGTVTLALFLPLKYAWMHRSCA
jgi:hypothetical protein